MGGISVIILMFFGIFILYFFVMMGIVGILALIAAISITIIYVIEYKKVQNIGMKILIPIILFIISFILLTISVFLMICAY